MANGVKVGTAYIEITADVTGVDKGIDDSLDKASKRARPAGKKIGKEISEGLKSGMNDQWDIGKDAFGIDKSLDKATKRAGPAGAKIGKEIIEGIRASLEGPGGVQESFSKVGDVVANITNAAANVGGVFGGHLDSLRKGGLGIAEELDSIGGAVQKYSDALKSIKTGDTETKLGGISTVLQGLGQGGAASQLDDFSKKFTDLQGGIKGTTDQLMTLTNNSGRIAGGLMAIGNAAGPLAIALGTLATINPGAFDALNKIANGTAGFMDYVHGFAPVTNYIDQALAALGLGPGNALGSTNTGGNYNPAAGGGGAPGAGPWDIAHAGSGGAGYMGGAYVPGLAGSGGAGGWPGGGGAGGGKRGSSGGKAPAALPDVYSGPDAGGKFPAWINSVGSQYGLTPSTYSGHQTSNRQEAGFAPNPQGSNRGVDWGGSVEDMQRFADFAMQHPELFEQVIWNNPKTGQKIGIAGGKVVGADYYRDDWGGHTNHVHTRFAHGFSIPSFEDGSGQLPDDTLAKLHQGEMVLPADQVDAAGGQAGVQSALDNSGGTPDQMDAEVARTLGYLPAAGQGAGVAGTSSLSRLWGLANEATAGAIDTGASMAQMAANVGLAASGAGPGAGAAAGFGIQMAASEAKLGAAFGFQVGSILTDALVEQAFPFGAPRWIGYDYTQFVPQLSGMTQGAVTTGEKAIQAAAGGKGQAGAVPFDQAPGGAGGPGGPVNPMQMPGSQPMGPSVPPLGSPPPSAPPPSAGIGGGAGASGIPGPVGGPPLPQMPIGPGPFVPGLTTPSQDQAPSSLLPLPFDDGGVWPHGTTGINMSGRPELVLSPSQMDAMATAPSAHKSGGDTYYITAANLDEAMDKLDQRKRLNRMRYGNRYPGG